MRWLSKLREALDGAKFQLRGLILDYTRRH